MNVILSLLVGFGIAYFLQERRIRRLKSTVALLKEQIEAQRQAFESMMFEFNHRSSISPAASMVGVITVIIQRMIQSLLRPLKERYGAQNPYTRDIISELEWIVNADLSIALTAGEKWLQTTREWLRQYSRYQYTPGSKEYETG